MGESRTGPQTSSASTSGQKEIILTEAFWEYMIEAFQWTAGFASCVRATQLKGFSDLRPVVGYILPLDWVIVGRGFPMDKVATLRTDNAEEIQALSYGGINVVYLIII